MLQFIGAVFAGFIEGIWRRWFGGWLEEDFKTSGPKWLVKVLHSRGTQTAFNLLFLTGLFMCNPFWTVTPLCSWIISLGVPSITIAITMACIFQFMFWSKSHGAAFDLGRDEKPTPETIERYHKYVWAILPDKIIPEEHWYGFLYDFVWMFARYTYGAMFMLPFMWTFDILWLGLMVASIYALCWTINDRDNWLFKYFPYNMVSSGTNLAEIVCGFVTGYFLVMM